MPQPIGSPEDPDSSDSAGSSDCRDSADSPDRLLARAARRLFARGSWREASHVAAALRTETVGGALLLAAAVVALVWANSPWAQGYTALRAVQLGPAAWHLDLSLAQWAGDGLLAVFFLVAGIELKHEFVAGELADLTKAAVPVVAAVCGVAMPAIVYTVVAASLSGGDPAVARGWAVPTATDIAFALAVLAVIGTHLPAALRAFLLTLAVVDDLIAITIIACFYTAELSLLPLALATVPLALWWLLLRRSVTSPLLLAGPAIATWLLVHASGVHATVAGVLLGILVPCARRPGDGGRGSMGERLENALRPWSAGVAVPVFALFAAGVSIGGTDGGTAGPGGGATAALRDPAAVGVVAALLLGKFVGVFGGTWLVAKFTRADLDDDITWPDLAGLAILTGVGFTVSLLVGDLAFGGDGPREEHVRLAVLVGSATSAILAALVLRRRNQHYREVARREAEDHDGDGVPDAFERG